MKSPSFERYYYERVALSESCGCAEQVINIRDLEAFARAPDQGACIAATLAGFAKLFRCDRRRRRRPGTTASGVGHPE